MSRRGLSRQEVADELDVSARTIQRWAAERPDLFKQHDPGSLEHRRAILLEALETGNLAERLRAVDLLERLGAQEKPRRSGRILVNLGPETCPHCGGSLRGENLRETEASP